MTYTNAWNNTRPAGSTRAGNIDDEIRLLRQQIAERMTGTLVEDWSADPVVPLATSGAVSSKVILLPFTSFHGNELGGSAFYDLQNIVYPGDVGALVASVPAAQFGSTITKIEYLVDKNTAPGLLCDLWSTDISHNLGTVGTSTNPSRMTVTGSGAQFVETAPLSIPVDIDHMYQIRVVSNNIGMGGFFKLYMARVTLT